MTREEHIQCIVEMFPQLPNPEHNPKKFNYYLNLYKWITKQQSKEIRDINDK